MNDFKIYNKSKYLIMYMEKYIINNIPKIHYLYRKGLEESVINLNYYLIKSNINTGNIRNKYQKEVLVSIYMIDTYIGILLHLNIINKKRFIAFVRMLNEIRKMCLSWINNEESK